MGVFTLFEKERQEEIASIEGDRVFFDSDLYRRAKDNVELMQIYKRMELAAKHGNYTLLNELYGNFKLAAATSN